MSISAKQLRTESDEHLREAEELREKADRLQTAAETFATAAEVVDAVNGSSGPGPKKPAKKKRRGRPPMTAAKKATKKKAAKKKAKKGVSKKRPKNELPLDKTVIKILKSSKTGLKLAEVVEKVIESGYQTTSTEKGFTQNVYQALNGLMNKKKWVVRDKDSHRYKLNAKGKKAA